MESAYLKNHVGPVLAKAIAETVIAQPANPQEYLALYLLHHIQEEERKAVRLSRQKKVSVLEQEWSAEQAVRERAAADVIARGMANFRAKIAARKAAELELQEAYEEAAAEAEELLEQEEALRAERRAGSGDGKDEGDNEAGLQGENKKRFEKLRETEEKLTESRAAFYRAQRFLLRLQKSHLGQLKGDLVAWKERVRMGKAEVEQIADNTAADEADAAETDWRLAAKQEAQRLSEAAAMLVARARGHRSHDRISVHHVLYRVLRCVCYLVLDATPKATDSAVKVAALVKPTVLAATLRAFNPVAAYDRAVPLRLERNLPATAGADDGNDDREENNAGLDGAGGEAESYPMPQPKTRQVRRAQRVLRALLADAEYVCQVNPADFFDEEVIEMDAAEAAEKQDSGDALGRRTIQDEVAEAEAAAETAAKLKESVEEQTKQRGGVVLWALLQFLTTAVAFRQHRDEVVALRRELGLDTSSSGGGASPVLALLEELPEEEEEDEMNDETIMNEEGELDVVEVRRLQARIGTDEDEQLVKLWEAKDARRVRELESRADAFRVAGDAEDEGEDGEGEGIDDE